MEMQVVGTRAWAFWRRNSAKLGVVFPLSSYEWRTAYPNEDSCPVCHGGNGRSVQTKDGVVYPCVCLMPVWADEQMKLRDIYQSKYEPARLEDLDFKMAGRNTDQLINASLAAQRFIDNLDSWLVLAGPPGVGKSHILRAIATAIKPIGLFITATDFERQVFERVKSQNLDDYIKRISQAAVLLFDDLGAEYGSDFVRSQLTAVFIARDHQAKDLPMVVTTNLSREKLLQIPRIGSRLLNQDVVKFYSLNLDDYRTRDYRMSHPEVMKPKW